jgi:small subunit ribosomal protein S3Ae
MTIDKNKKPNKNNKNTRRKNNDNLSKKEWINVNSPNFFGNKIIGKTITNKIMNVNQSTENLRNRIYEISLADLNKNEELAFKKIKFKGQDFKDGICSTSFFGMELTRDKLQSVIRKWQTLIETNVDIKTRDGYFLRIFTIAFSRRRRKQIKKTSYLNSAQIRSVRRKILEVIVKETNDIQIKDLVAKLLSEKIIQEIERECMKVFPLHNIFIRKVKLLNEK